MLAKAVASGDLIATLTVCPYTVCLLVIEAKFNRECSTLHQFNKHVFWNDWL